MHLDSSFLIRAQRFKEINLFENLERSFPGGQICRHPVESVRGAVNDHRNFAELLIVNRISET